MTLPSAPNIPNARITTRIFRSRISDFPISDFRMILIRFSSIGSTPTFLYFELYFTYNTFIRFFIHFIRFSRRRAYARNVRHRFLYWHSTNFQYHFHNSIGISALPTQQNTFFALLRYKTLDTPNKVMILILTISDLGSGVSLFNTHPWPPSSQEVQVNCEMLVS